MIIYNNKKKSNNFAQIRHGETANNKDGLNRGMLDVPLNDHGKDQALIMAKKLKKEKLTGLITSPLKRAKQTAEIISIENDIPIFEENEGLLPWDIGAFEGKNINQTLPILHRYMDTPDKIVPKGESFNIFKERTLKEYKKLMEKYPDEKLGMVSHHRLERLTEAVVSYKGGTGKFHLPIQKTKGIDPGDYKVHKWKHLFPKK